MTFTQLDSSRCNQLPARSCAQVAMIASLALSGAISQRPSSEKRTKRGQPASRDSTVKSRRA